MSTYDPTDLEGQARSKADDTAKKRVERKNEEADFVWLMSSKQGRRIVWRLLSQAGVFRSSFTQNAMQTSFNEGFRNYGLRLMEQINTLCPELYSPMSKEALNGRTDDGNADHSN